MNEKTYLEKENERVLLKAAQKGKHAEHIERHKLLHKYFNELVVDMMRHTGMLPSKMTVTELMDWSYEQTITPSGEE